MNRSIWFAVFVCALIAALPAKATDFTLSEAAILSLDYNNPDNYYSPPPTATITSEQDIPGTGVKFTIHFASTNAWDTFRLQASDKNNGAGTLGGLNVSAFANFDLKFTLVSIDGSTSGSQLFNVGALIGPYGISPYAYRPETVSLTGSYPVSTVSSTTVATTNLTVVGFAAYEYPGWSAGPHDVTLLVQPAPGAVQIVPEPATWMLAMLGAGMLFGTRRMLRR
jgi:hypothetical protein